MRTLWFRHIEVGRFSLVRPRLNFVIHTDGTVGSIVQSLKLPARLWRELIDRLLEHDDAEQLSRIAAPTLLLWGDQDALFSRTEQDRFLAACPATSLLVYEGTGHCPNWEQPERVASDIADFSAAL